MGTPATFVNVIEHSPKDRFITGNLSRASDISYFDPRTTLSNGIFGDMRVVRYHIDGGSAFKVQVSRYSILIMSDIRDGHALCVGKKKLMLRLVVFAPQSRSIKSTERETCSVSDIIHFPRRLPRLTSTMSSVDNATAWVLKQSFRPIMLRATFLPLCQLGRSCRTDSAKRATLMT